MRIKQNVFTAKLLLYYSFRIVSKCSLIQRAVKSNGYSLLFWWYVFKKVDYDIKINAKSESIKIIFMSVKPKTDICKNTRD